MKKRIIILIGIISVLFAITYGAISVLDVRIGNQEDIVSNDLMTSKNIEKPKAYDFVYGVGPRFNPIKKTEFSRLRAFSELIDPSHAERIVKYHSVEVILIIDDKQSDIREGGNSDTFSEGQLNFLQSLEYSTNLVVRADYEEFNKDNNRIENSYATPHLTIVPAKQAKYAQGEQALIKYLDEASKELREKLNVDSEKLFPAKLFFTVTKEGAIKDLKLNRSSNFPELDEKIMELLKKDIGTWIPAENQKGEKVDQELVVSYGLMGC